MNIILDIVGDRGDNKEMELEKHNFKVMFLFNAMPYQYIDPLFILVHRKFKYISESI
jgi:hypothetical protein